MYIYQHKMGIIIYLLRGCDVVFELWGKDIWGEDYFRIGQFKNKLQKGFITQ